MIMSINRANSSLSTLLLIVMLSMSAQGDDLEVYAGTTGVNATFVSPIVAINQHTRLRHKEELFFAVFKPSDGMHWLGNLKKYRISGDKILDSNGVYAIDSGFFAENSHSYWSKTRDGNNASEGGAASRLDLVRKIYFFDNVGTVLLPRNEISESNNNISAADLDLDSSTAHANTRELVLKWARGVDIKDDDGDGLTSDARLQMGAPLHSQPIIVVYGANDSAIFVATNHGFLHSIDAATGKENFALMPKELLKNMNKLYRNAASLNHIYGLDGDIVYREYGDKKYIYLGMRRGGNNYYAVDVSDKLDPKIVFTIDGGNGDYVKMGQSWSRPIITKVKIGNTVKDVMIVGGGYDEQQDQKVQRSEDSLGNAVFMIDANNGELLWSASKDNADLLLTDMKYSVPSRIAVIDRDNDGFADHMYVADLGGQVFRLDIYNGKAKTDLVTGSLIAQLAGDTPQANRRFYYAPDITETSTANEHYFALAIGSGFRAAPLNTTIEDSFFMIKDKSVMERDSAGHYSFPSSVTTMSRLYDATEHLLSSDDKDEMSLQNTLLESKDGWMIRLSRNGEKVLASPLILDYQIFFTTYLPSSTSQSAFAPSAGKNRAYLVNLLNANAVEDLNKNNEKNATDRYALLNQTGIAPNAQILIENIVKPIVCIGAECVYAVSQFDSNGTMVTCHSDFECLAKNIYGNLERVKRHTWKTEVERE